MTTSETEKILKVGAENGWAVVEPTVPDLTCHPSDICLRKVDRAMHAMRLYVYHDESGRFDYCVGTYHVSTLLGGRAKEQALTPKAAEKFLKEMR